LLDACNIINENSRRERVHSEHMRSQEEREDDEELKRERGGRGQQNVNNGRKVSINV
jgi:hypothetical protein